MEALLRQSRSMCPFLQKTSPATLRTLSTTTRRASPGGGTISNLQVLARRCPVMGKALAVQSVKNGAFNLGGVFGGTRGYKSKASMHTTGARHATVAPDVLQRPNGGMICPDFGLEWMLMSVTRSAASYSKACGREGRKFRSPRSETRCSRDGQVRLRGILQCRA